MDPIDNNQFEIKPNTKSKRKINPPCPNVYLNPALDLLANDDPICNTAMEILPSKKRKRTKSSDIAVFENSALDLGISKAAVNEFLVRELENVRKNIRSDENLNECVSKNTSDSKIVVTGTDTNSIADSAEYSFKDISIPFEGPNIIKSNQIMKINEATYENLENVQIYITYDNNNLPISDFVKNSATLEEEKINNTINVENCTLVSKPVNLEEPIVYNSLLTPNSFEISKILDETNTGNFSADQKSIQSNNLQNNDISVINNTMCLQNNVTNQIFINNTNNFSLSFIDRLALDSPNISNQSLYLDDDLNESNIMEIKTIRLITSKKRISDKTKNTNPFLEQNVDDSLCSAIENPFLNMNDSTKPELEYNDQVHIIKPTQSRILDVNSLIPRRLFDTNCDTNSTLSTVNESCVDMEQHEYENIDDYRSESHIYENVGDLVYEKNYNKQSKILGQDVSRFSALDIMNINKNSSVNSSNESNDSKKDFKNQILKASNKLSKKVLKSIKNTFKIEKPEHNVTLNPYEVPRKLPKQKTTVKDCGIENPALNLNNSDEIEIEEIDDDEHQYETIKTIRNTRLNMNITPLRERIDDNIDISHNKTNTPNKKVRFDSTLNQEKIITGNSFEYTLQSPGFDAKIDKYHDELENCINERKFLQQNM